MSKYIPTNNKPAGQIKPKLKVKVVMNEQEKILNEYDAFQMLSEFNMRLSALKKLVQDLGKAVSGIMDAMSAATSDVSLANQPPAKQSTAPQPTKLKLPKLNKVSEGKLSGGEKFYGSDGGVKLQS